MATPIDAARLGYELDRRGMTSRDLADRIGCQPSTISAVRNGRPVRRRLLLAIVAALAAVPPIEGASLLLAEPGKKNADQGRNQAPVGAEVGCASTTLRP